MTPARSAGILMHPTSLPARFGIGDLGPEAEAFLDWLAAAGISHWQVLPLGPTGLGNSPYTSLSAFAGNPLLVSPERLVLDGLLPAGDLAEAPAFPAGHVDFPAVARWKESLLRRASESLRSGTGLAARAMREEFDRFRADPSLAAWLGDWALFSALKSRFGGREWTTWDGPLARHEPAAIDEARRALAAEIAHHERIQFLFFSQWERLREAARGRGIGLIGDLPIYVAHDSADVWSHASLFRLDEGGRPVTVAGVPPDYFAATGQRWGNPLYDWEKLEGTGFAWWIERMQANLRMADLVRVDHFRAFAAYWEIPAGEATAVNGRWVTGPGAKLFEALQRALGPLPLIAEDLGHITTEVTELRDRLGLPGMKVLQFALGADDSDHLPSRHTRDCVVYTGTHDNDTARGWFAGLPAKSRREARKLFRSRDENVPWNMIRTAWDSPAFLAVAPLQDALGLDSDARMNTPGRPQDNWTWRVLPEQLRPELARRLKRLARSSERLPATGAAASRKSKAPALSLSKGAGGRSTPRARRTD